MALMPIVNGDLFTSPSAQNSMKSYIQTQEGNDFRYDVVIKEPSLAIIPLASIKNIPAISSETIDRTNPR